MMWASFGCTACAPAQQAGERVRVDPVGLAARPRAPARRARAATAACGRTSGAPRSPRRRAPRAARTGTRRPASSRWSRARALARRRAGPRSMRATGGSRPRCRMRSYLPGRSRTRGPPRRAGPPRRRCRAKARRVQMRSLDLHVCLARRRSLGVQATRHIHGSARERCAPADRGSATAPRRSVTGSREAAEVAWVASVVAAGQACRDCVDSLGCRDAPAMVGRSRLGNTDGVGSGGRGLLSAARAPHRPAGRRLRGPRPGRSRCPGPRRDRSRSGCARAPAACAPARPASLNLLIHGPSVAALPRSPPPRSGCAPRARPLLPAPAPSRRPCRRSPTRSLRRGPSACPPGR